MSAQEMQESVPERQAAGIAALAPVVMVAGPFGSGMEEVAFQLAQRLGVPFYDPHKLETLARDREDHETAWQHLKESVGSFFDYWLSHLHQTIGMSRSEHLAHLQATIRDVACKGGVIAGICPHMVLPGNKLFRIQIKAGADFCARRLAMTHGIDVMEAITVYFRLEEERRKFLHDMFEDAFTDLITYDLVLDAESTSLEEMLATCLDALDHKGMLAKAA